MDASIQLLDSQHTVELLFASTRDAVFILDLKSKRIVHANEHLELLTGFPLDDLLGQDLTVLSPEPDDVPGRERPLAPSVIAEPGLHEEISMARADGFTAIATLRVAHIEQEGRLLAVCIARDETERRMLKRELITKHVALLDAHRDLEARQREIAELSQRVTAVSKRAMLAEIIAEVAHALNNPLGALISSLRLLERIEVDVPERDQARYERSLARCRQLSDRLARVVDELRVTCREGGASTTGECELSDQVRSALAVVDHRIPQQVQVELDCAAARVATPGDEVHHAITNLIANALEAVGEAGVIEIRCGIAGESAFVQVDDDGPGIAEDIAVKIFDPFFSTKPKRRGTGVGLSMVRRMAMQYGGRVVAQGQGALGGASFRIELPLAQPCESVKRGEMPCTA